MELKLSMLGGLVVIVGILFFIFAGGSGPGNYVRISDSDPVLGRDDAPVTVVVFGDYRCGYTEKFFEELLPQLKEAYIDTGKVRLVYKQISDEEESRIEAEASLCAHDQGKFWPFVSLLFDKKEEWGRGENETFDEYVNELGLDEDEFSACLKNNAHRTQIEQDFDEGKRLGVSGTPTFFINSLKVEGVLPFGEFEDILSKFSYI
jgi:protein-disulfide isomerase